MTDKANSLFPTLTDKIFGVGVAILLLALPLALIRQITHRIPWFGQNHVGWPLIAILLIGALLQAGEAHSRYHDGWRSWKVKAFYAIFLVVWAGYLYVS